MSRVDTILALMMLHNERILDMSHPKPNTEVENAALFLRLGLPPTLIPLEIGAFRKHFSNRRVCVLVRTENILKTELVENDGITVIV